MSNASDLTVKEIQTQYPIVYEVYNLLASTPSDKCDERLAFWVANGVTSLDRWTVPYFLKHETTTADESTYSCHPCPRLNSSFDGGKCNDCVKSTCQYDRVCFMCGEEGHGAFQIFPGGKLRGEYKCDIYRQFSNEMQQLVKSKQIDDIQLQNIFMTAAATTTDNEQQQTVGLITTSAVSLMNVKSPLMKKSSNSNSKISMATAKNNNNVSPYLVAAALSNQSLLLPSIAENMSHMSHTTTTTSNNTPISNSPSSQLSQLPPSVLACDLTNMDEYHFASTCLNNNNISNTVVVDAPQVRLRYATWLTAREYSPGPELVHCKGVLVTNNAQHEEVTVLAWPHQHSSVNNQHNNNSKNFTQSSPSSSLLHFNTDNNKCNNPSSSSSSTSPPTTTTTTATLTPSPNNMSDSLTATVVDLLTLSNELKILRILANNYSKGIAKYLTRHPVMIPSSHNNNNNSHHDEHEQSQHHQLGPLTALICEYSDIGYLDKFIDTHKNIVLSSSSSLNDSKQSSNLLFHISDIKCASVMLLDALHHCHRMNICHRDLRPSHVLVTRPYRYQRNLFMNQFNLKLCDFQLTGLSDLYSTFNNTEQDKYTAPEVTVHMRVSGEQYDYSSDVWALGMVMYSLTTGHCMINHSVELLSESQWQALDIADPRNSSQSERMTDVSVRDKFQQYIQLRTADSYNMYGGRADVVLQNIDEECHQHYHQLTHRHRLQHTQPTVHDFIDRCVRPLNRRRVTGHTALLRCHPLLWSVTKKRDFLLFFTHCCTINQNNNNNSLSIENDSTTTTTSSHTTNNNSNNHHPLELLFLEAFEKYAPVYVFSGTGWVQNMTPVLLEQIQPTSIKNELWWSGRGLLLAIRYQLTHLESHLHSAVTGYSDLTLPQTLAVYLREITEVCYPTLLNLIFELGSTLGQWITDEEDEDEDVTFKWK